MPDLFNEAEIVYGHNRTQTYNVKWLRIKDIHPKLLKKGTYDIGGTYSSDIPEYWFLISTDNFGDNFMLHLLVGNHHESSFTVQVSSTSQLTHLQAKKSHNITRSHLPLSMKYYHFKNSPNNTYNFIKTYSFTSFDLENLAERELLICVRVLPLESKSVDNSIALKVKLDHDLSYLLKEPLYSDFTIESCDGHQFKVHRTVLAAQSEVFKAMLRQETAESQNSVVQLHFTKDELACMLQFMYTGSVDNIMTCDCTVLLMMADHYNLPGLSILAQNALCRQLNDENVIDMVIHGENYNSDLLKNTAIRYIKQHPAFFKSATWKNLQDPHMIKFVINLTQGNNK